LRGNDIAVQFVALVERYVQDRFGSDTRSTQKVDKTTTG
jgi:hypothetical protein